MIVLIMSSSSISILKDEALADKSFPSVSWLAPATNWLQLTCSDGSRSWNKILIITGTASGAVLASYYIVRKCRSRKKKTNKSDSNGSIKVNHGTVDGLSRSSTLVASPVKSKARNEFEFDVLDGPSNDHGLGLLLSNSNAEDGGEFYSQYSHLSTPRGFAGSSFRRRNRSDSLTSGTTLLLTNRDPSELLLYGLESLKRSIRLWEETRNKLVMGNDGFGE